MKLNKPKFWDQKKSFFSLVLLPISLLTNLVIFFKKKIIKSKKFNTPIICIGNIYLGGTGKTPLAIFIARELSKIGKKPSIVKKYYEDQHDEHELTKKYFKDVIINPKRSRAILESKKRDFDLVILDDGFQDYKIKKDLNVICFNQNQLIGNGLIIPAGPLRENLTSLKNAQIVVINGKKNIDFEKKILSYNQNLSIFYSKYEPINLDDFKNRKLLAFAGIGNPENFFKLIEENGLNIFKKVSFPDHYNFKKKEILDLISEAKHENCKIITTEKDFFRIKKFNISEIEYLGLKLNIENNDDLLNKILKVYD